MLEYRLSLSPDVTLSAKDEGLILYYHGASFTLDGRAHLLADLDATHDHAVCEDDYAALLCGGAESIVGLAEAYFLIDRMSAIGILQVQCFLEGEVDPVLQLKPITSNHSLSNAPPDQPLIWSRFAYLRRDGDCLIAESPVASARLTLIDPRMIQFIHRLQQAQKIDQNPASDLLAHDLIVLLYSTGFLTTAGEESAEHTTWEFHDLLFHMRSRIGYHDQPVGAAYPFADKMPPQAAWIDRKFPANKLITLPEADLEAHVIQDPPFCAVLEGRHSVRRASNALTLDDLGAFLFRSARIRSKRGKDPSNPQSYAVTSRPYPTGGASYDLEIYPVIRQCTGLDSGLYYYNPVHHALEEVQIGDQTISGFIDLAAVSAGGEADPSVVFLIASRFQRLSWKYRSISYATTLRNVGVLYQTFYLVSTAMGLGGCALGNGNSALFAQETGLDPLVESTVGEFMLFGRDAQNIGSVAKFSGG